MDLTTRLLTMGAAGAGGAEKAYVEDVFSTWLYTGNGSTQTITNGIDLSGEGGLVWFKQRNGTQSNVWQDTARGNTKYLMSNATDAEYSVGSNYISSFNSDGFSLGSGSLSTNGNTYGTWTFRKAAKFFDVVTYTGNGSNRTIAHNLGSVPGCIIIKRTDANGDWPVYHISLGNTDFLELNQTQAKLTNSAYWNNTTPTSTVFSLGDHPDLNTNGSTYVAYLFAHDAGGFGDSGNDSVIKCGSYTGNGSTSGPTIDLGWEPQWVLTKPSSSVGRWTIHDNMRGFAVSGGAGLQPHLSDAEYSSSVIRPTATGFQLFNTSSDFNGNGVTYIYIAIRRGPMKTPTDATKVFDAEAITPNSAQLFNTGFVVDASWGKWKSGGGNTYDSVTVYDRLRGYQVTEGAGANNKYLLTASTAAEASSLSINTLHYGADRNNGILYGSGASYLANITYAFRRAPGFFDVVAYTGNGSTTHDVSHNLGVPPEIIITKRRDTTSTIGWFTSSKYYYTLSLWDTNGRLNDGTIGLSGGGVYGPDTYITATQFRIRTNFADINASGGTYIAYLFATCPGVSKCGGYTGTGTTLSIDCGFTNGARFVLIKRADAAGDWYVWDTARGIVAGNDPYLLLNSTAAEVTNTDYIDPLSSGFQISSTAPAAINANGGSFIYLAIA